MKKLVLFLVLICNLFAIDTTGSFNYAMGGLIGTTNGVNVLAYDGEGRGYQLTFSISNKSDAKFSVAFDKLFFYDVNDTIPVYAGLGAKVSDSIDKYIGIRAVFGLSYFVNSLSDSVELYGEVAPTIYLTDLQDFIQPEFGVGVRYYF